METWHVVLIVIVMAIAGRLFVWLSPVLQSDATLAMFIVGELHKFAQWATHLAYAADMAVVAYHSAKSRDRRCPESLWRPECGR